MLTSSQLRPGMAIRHQGQNYKIVAAEYHPGQGKMGGVTHARLQNLDTRTYWEHSFRADMKVEEIVLERQTFEFLYAADGQCFFMNADTYDQTSLPAEAVGPQARLLEPGMQLAVEFLEGRPVSVLFPAVLELKILETAPPIHQQDSNFKPAKIAGGVEVLVPQFIKTGDVIRLDVPNMKYMDRARSETKVKAI
jgi:elongation factor P